MSYMAALRIYAPLGVWVTVAITAAVWLTTTDSTLAAMSPAIGLGGGALLLLGAARLGTRANAHWNASRRRALWEWSELVELSLAGVQAAAKPLLDRLSGARARLND